MPELALDPAKRHSADLDQRHRPLPHERDARTASGKLFPVKLRYGVVSRKRRATSLQFHRLQGLVLQCLPPSKTCLSVKLHSRTPKGVG